MDARYLAAELAERMQCVVPSGVHVEAQGGDVGVWWESAPDLWCVIGVKSILEQDGDEAQHITNSCYSVLSTVQDEVAEVTTEPWPGDGRSMPLPGVSVTLDEVNLWYGDQEAPVILFPAIARQPALPPSTASDFRVVEGEMYGAPVPGSWPGGQTSDGLPRPPSVQRPGSGRYRWRTWLRRRLPYRPPVYLLIPKGRGDCGEHDWYKATDDEDHCYHCRAVRTPSEFPPGSL